MFSCLCSRQKRFLTLTRDSRHYRAITEKLNQDEILILELIYQDLANRDNQKLLTQQNFLQFFNLSGIWAYKLFQQFDEGGNQSITSDQFLYGMSMIVKAPFTQKIKLLFNLFEGEYQQGISFKKFMKMLYNLSKEELKEILMEDGVFVEEIVIPLDVLENLAKTKSGKSVVEVDFNSHEYPENLNNQFEKAYKELLEGYVDPGTLLEFKTNRMTYKIKYCNMTTLVRQFAHHVFNKYDIDQKTGKMSFLQFREWIQNHMKLYNFYYSSFHHELWVSVDEEPYFIAKDKIQKTLDGRLLYNDQITAIYGMLVDQALVICDTRKSKKRPSKVICLTGLTISKVKDKNGFGMSINHISDNYMKSIIYFNSENQLTEWIEYLKIYDENTLYNRYILDEQIGTGQFSVVYKSHEIKTGKEYALKMIDLSKLTKQAYNAIKNQSHIMEVVNCPQIVKYKESITTKTHSYIILQYVEGCDLSQYVRKYGTLQQHQCAFIIGQIIRAVIYLHAMDIVHRDLKPENIMVKFKKNNEGSHRSINSASSRQENENSSPIINKTRPIETIKIIDFGLASHLSELVNLSQQKICRGTPGYIAPQILLSRKPTLKIDTFAIGSIMYYLLRGKRAFNGKDNHETLIQTVVCDLKFTDQKWNKVSNQAKDLIRRLLSPQPQQRIQLEQALNDKWFSLFVKKNTNFVKKTHTLDCQEIPKSTSSRRRKRSSLQKQIRYGKREDVIL